MTPSGSFQRSKRETWSSVGRLNRQLLRELRRREERRVVAAHPLLEKRPDATVRMRRIDVAPPDDRALRVARPTGAAAEEGHRRRLRIVDDDEIAVEIDLARVGLVPADEDVVVLWRELEPQRLERSVREHAQRRELLAEHLVAERLRRPQREVVRVLDRRELEGEELAVHVVADAVRRHRRDRAHHLVERARFSAGHLDEVDDLLEDERLGRHRQWTSGCSNRPRSTASSSVKMASLAITTTPSSDTWKPRRRSAS
jgi:hypothetical protein